MTDNQITIDGRHLTFSDGDTILDVCKQNGVFVPTLCFLKGATPTGACRICVVEVKGARVLLPSCATPATPNMVVQTHSPKVLEARRMILALLMKSGHHNCAISEHDERRWTRFQQEVQVYDQSHELCPAHSACKLQAYAYRYQVDTSGLSRLKTTYPMEMASPLIVRDFSRCIMCGRCVDACHTIQVNNAISHGFRGAEAKIVASGDRVVGRSTCVFCGECIQACPVAALVDKKSRFQIRPWEARHVRTTCHYCGVGCQMDLHIKDNRIMKVTGVAEAEPNDGRLCVMGRFGYDFVHSEERLPRPMIRENGQLRSATWDEALNLIASKIKETKDKYGVRSIAGICTAKMSNEGLYLMQKLFRCAIGSNHIVSPFAASGLNHPLRDLEDAKRIILIGGDVTRETPVAGSFIKRAVNKGCQLIVVDSHPVGIADFATLNLKITEGTGAVLINGMIRELIDRGRPARDEIKEIATAFPLDRVCEITGVSRTDLLAAIDILDTDEPVSLVYGSRGATAPERFLHLQEVLGNLTRPGGGVNFMGQLNNSQGACDMGVLPDMLPGYKSIEVPEDRAFFERAWRCKLEEQPGESFTELIQRMAADQEDRVRLVYSVGQNLAIATPDVPAMTKALESLDFLIVQDILEHETMEYADVVLPAAAWGEVDGTYTNCERRVSRVRRAVPCHGDARPATWIFTQLSNRLGQNWHDSTPQDIWEKEITQLVGFLKGITYARLGDRGLQWPVPDMVSEGTPRLESPYPKPRRSPWVSFNYHHRTLLEQCEGLLESLPKEEGLGTRETIDDPKLVEDKFIELLAEEGKSEAKDTIDHILDAYQDRKGGLIPVLQQVQEILGYLPIPAQDYIALGLGVPPSDVFGVVTFYSFFTMIPRGRHTIRVCLGTACFVKGSGKILQKLEEHLKIKLGGTTEDREFSLDVVRCLGACGLAPVVVVDDVTHGDVDPFDAVRIIESHRDQPSPAIAASDSASEIRQEGSAG